MALVLASKIINDVIYRIIAKKDPRLAKIIYNWHKIVGGKFAGKSYPVKITGNYRSQANNKIADKILYVEIENSSLALLFRYQQNIIKENLAILTGYQDLKEIRTKIYKET